MSQLRPYGGGSYRMTPQQIRQLRYEMRKAQKKLEEMQGLIDAVELHEEIAADTTLQEQLETLQLGDMSSQS